MFALVENNQFIKIVNSADELSELIKQLNKG